MFEFLKNILGKPAQDQAGDNSIPRSPAPRPPAALPKPPAASRPKHPGVAQPVPASSPARRASTASVQIPLQAVLTGLPLELKGRVLQNEVGAAAISLPLEKIVSQLSSGSVKMTFGELRSFAPHVFSPENDHDAVSVPLPLNEILSRLNPALLVRRPGQKTIRVPDDLRGPFGDRGEGLAFAGDAPKSETAAAPVRGTTPAPSSGTPAPGAVPMPPKPATFSRAIQPGPHPAPSPDTTSFTSGNTPIPFRPNFGSANGAVPPRPATAHVPKPNPPAPTLAAATPIPMKPTAPAPAPEPAAAAHSATEAGLTVSLAALAEHWPDALRDELVRLNLTEASVTMPVVTIGESLKRGKVAFTWKVIRSWIRPEVQAPASAHDTLTLELPLRVVAPLFIQHQKESAKPQEKVKIDESIPNLFFGFPQPDAPPAEQAQAVTKPVETNYYIWDDNSDTAMVERAATAPRPTPGTSFVTRYATPNEVVSRAAALDGVSGALIALPDGLMVASQLSPDLNGETLAAFLPHIFGKVSQCTKELRMGELNNLNFTVGNVPWKIFRVNAIYFAAFGHAGQALPTAQLAALAGELDRKKQ